MFVIHQDMYGKGRNAKTRIVHYEKMTQVTLRVAAWSSFPSGALNKAEWRAT